MDKSEVPHSLWTTV